MKHAILILAHKEIEQLCRLVNYFDRDCEVYVHIDRKQEVDAAEEARLHAYKQVKLISRDYEVNWGGTSVLESEMHLLRTATRFSGADYYHLISGQDYPTRPLSQFLAFFKKNAGKEFINYVHLPHPNWEDNTFRRLQYYYPYDYAAEHHNPRRWVKEQIEEQRAKGMKRPIPDEFDHLYGSSQWFSITHTAAMTLLGYTDSQPQFYKRMWMTFAPEECYVATVLVNLLGKEKIMPYNLRFIRWRYENGNRPANLGCEHFHCLLEEECLFARKFELSGSTLLLGMIDRYLLKDAQLQHQASGGWNYNGFLQYRFDHKFADYVVRLWRGVDARTGLDMGCGDGLYVAHWRSCRMSFAGYDANPNTEKLSAMLLPDGDEPCGVADITTDLESENTFDVVVCKDVLQYIPHALEEKAIRNLTSLSDRFIVLSWDTPEDLQTLPHRQISEYPLLAEFYNNGFALERYMTADMQVILNRKNCCVLQRKEQLALDSNT